MDSIFHLILQFLMLSICAQEAESSQRIKHNNNETAELGRNVTIFCNLTSLADVVQITWQKIQDSLPQNIGTYSNKYGEKILPPYVDRLHCKIIEPNSSFITIREVTFEDEACYKCLFNTFPHGSHGGQICLSILTLSELTTELQYTPDSEDYCSLKYSAVGKPAPEISLYPSVVLLYPPKEHLAQNPNGTVTVTKTVTISLKTVKSLGLQHLIVSMAHPLRFEEKIVPLSVKEERLIPSVHIKNTPCLSEMRPAIVLAVLFCISCSINILLCLVLSKKKSESTTESSSPAQEPERSPAQEPERSAEIPEPSAEAEYLMSCHHQSQT